MKSAIMLKLIIEDLGTGGRILSARTFSPISLFGCLLSSIGVAQKDEMLPFGLYFYPNSCILVKKNR
jgi:hypothetical protein